MNASECLDAGDPIPSGQAWWPPDSSADGNSQHARTDLPTSYVGVSFYRTPDSEELHNAVAQVFNERGVGVVVRGGTAKISKTDRRPHLTETDAWKLLSDALAEYRRTHGHQPARIVVQKPRSSALREVLGFLGASTSGTSTSSNCCGSSAAARRTCSAPGSSRPNKGYRARSTSTASCCTRAGRSPTFAPTPACTSPSRSFIPPATDGTDLRNAAIDVLAMSKMNWNNAQLDERDPLTLRTAHRVGAILKHVPPDERS